MVGGFEWSGDSRLKRAAALLSEVVDPEIPVLNILELGIVRKLFRNPEGKTVIRLTPTYSGCPAIDQIMQDVQDKMREGGFEDFELEVKLTPPWSTDDLWISAKEKLRQYGIAPPLCTALEALESEVLPKCPRCGSAEVNRLSQFSSTACKSLWKCLDCKEPFDYFKPH